MQKSKQFQQRDKAQISGIANRYHGRGSSTQSNVDKVTGKFVNKMKSPDVNILKAQRLITNTNEGLNQVQFPLINGVPTNQPAFQNSVNKNKLNMEKHVKKRFKYLRDNSSGNDNTNSIERVSQKQPTIQQVKSKQIQQKLTNLIDEKIENFQDYKKKSGIIQRCTSQISNQVVSNQLKLAKQVTRRDQGSLDSNKKSRIFNQFSTQIQVKNSKIISELSPPKASINVTKRQSAISNTQVVTPAQIYKQSGRFNLKSDAQRKLEFNGQKATSIYLSKSPYGQSIKKTSHIVNSGKSYSPDRGHKQLIFNNFDQIKKQQQSMLRRESLIEKGESLIQHVTSQVGLARDNNENIQYKEYQEQILAQTEQTYRQSVSPQKSKISQQVQMNFGNHMPRKSRNLNRATATQESPSKMNSLTGGLVTYTQKQIQVRGSMNKADLMKLQSEISPYLVPNQQVSSPQKHISTSYKTYDQVMKLLDNKSVTKEFFDRYGPNVAKKMKKSSEGTDLATMISQNNNDEQFTSNQEHLKQASKHLRNKQAVKRKRLNNGNHSVKNPEYEKKVPQKKTNQRQKNQVSLDKYFQNRNEDIISSPKQKQASILSKEKTVHETAMQNYQPVDMTTQSKFTSELQSSVKRIGVQQRAQSNEFEVNINNQSGEDSYRNQLQIPQNQLQQNVIYNEYNDMMKLNSTQMSKDPSCGSTSFPQFRDEQSRLSCDQSSFGKSTNQAMQILAPDAKTKQHKQQFKSKYQKIKGMKNALIKAKVLGYIGNHQTKNKDAAAWTQPKDPLQIKLETLGERSNIYCEDLFNHTFESIDDSFISVFDREFVKNYGDEAFTDMIKAEMRDGTCDDFMINQQMIGRQLRIKVIDWLYEVIKKFKITDRSIIFQTVELMDKYFINCKEELPQSDLQMIAVTCFFIAAKNILIDPFTLQNAIEHMCYGKYSQEQFLESEKNIRLTSGYINEASNHMDFASLFLKIMKSELSDHLSETKGYKATRISAVTIRFFKEVDMLSYEFCKLALCDPFVKRYLKSYVAASIVICSFEIMVDEVQNDHSKAYKIDISHIQAIYSVMQKLFSRFFGYNKYVFCQFLGKALINRYKVFFYQYSGILDQQKYQLHHGKEINTSKNDYKISQEFSENCIPYIFKEKVNKHLYDLNDLSKSIRSDSFYRHFIPEISQIPITWNSSIDIFSIQNDEKFHNILENSLLDANIKYFKQFQELQDEFQRQTQACARDNISLSSKDWEFIDSNQIESKRNEQFQMLKFRNGDQIITIQEPNTSKKVLKTEDSDWFVSVKSEHTKVQSDKKPQISQMNRQVKILAKDSSNPSMFCDIPQTVTQGIREQDSAQKQQERDQRFKDKSADISFEDIKTFEDASQDPYQQAKPRNRAIMPHGGIPPNISMSPTRTRNQLVHSRALPQIAVSLAQNSKYSLGTTDFKLSSLGKNTETMYINQEPFTNDSYSHRFETNPSLRKQDKSVLQNLNSNSEKNHGFDDHFEQQHLDKILENQIEENAKSTFNTRNHPLKQSGDEVQQEPELSKETSYSNFYDHEESMLNQNKIIEVEGEEDLSSKPVSPKYRKRSKKPAESPPKMSKTKIIGNNANRVNGLLNGTKNCPKKNQVIGHIGGKKVTAVQTGIQAMNHKLGIQAIQLMSKDQSKMRQPSM